jgi:hypothetical protein
MDMGEEEGEGMESHGRSDATRMEEGVEEWEEGGRVKGPMEELPSESVKEAIFNGPEVGVDESGVRIYRCPVCPYAHAQLHKVRATWNFLILFYFFFVKASSDASSIFFFKV